MSATPRGPLVLIVIDGFGIAAPGPGNAVSLARTPALDALAAIQEASDLASDRAQAVINRQLAVIERGDV